MSKFLYALIFCLVLFTPAAAQAHVLQRDSSGKIGALLHITPDDNPIAGEQSNIYIDLQPLPPGELTVVLEITTAGGSSEAVAAELVGSGARAQHTFPAQGVYELRLTITSNSDTYALAFTQRVSRGVGSADVQQTHSWAEAVLFVGAAAAIILAVLFFSHLPTILRHIRQNTP